ncbi:hypothetical protein THAOC_10827, partial [Thalassiosira oceanica]
RPIYSRIPENASASVGRSVGCPCRRRQFPRSLKKPPCATVDVASRQRGCEEEPNCRKSDLLDLSTIQGRPKAEGEFPMRGTGATREKVQLPDLHKILWPTLVGGYRSGIRPSSSDNLLGTIRSGAVVAVLPGLKD